jgi:hypothetical protein
MNNSYSAYKVSKIAEDILNDLYIDCLPRDLEEVPQGFVAKVMNDFRHGVVHNRERYELPL